MVGPVALEDVSRLLRQGKTTKVWKACKEGDTMRFFGTSPQVIFNSLNRTAELVRRR